MLAEYRCIGIVSHIRFVGVIHDVHDVHGWVWEISYIDMDQDLRGVGIEGY